MKTFLSSEERKGFFRTPGLLLLLGTRWKFSSPGVSVVLSFPQGLFFLLKKEKALAKQARYRCATGPLEKQYTHVLKTVYRNL